MNPPWAPFPTVTVYVALFLQAVSEGQAAALLVKRRKNSGEAGAADGVRGGLRFAQLHLGFAFGLGEEEEVETAGTAQAVSQQFPGARNLSLLPRDIFTLMRLGSCGSWVIEYLAGAAVSVGHICDGNKPAHCRGG